MMKDLPEFAFWAALAVLFYAMHRRWNTAFINRSYYWDTTTEEAREAEQFAAYRNTRKQSHLSLVSGGDHGNRDMEAIRNTAGMCWTDSESFGFYRPTKGGSDAA